ncbi:hypothetical protein MPLDJ20_260155 [Mesorhizobium plurifarium]|uniref:Uncharacterized protein n=1 Tax=Mesorhizobium plurifarium TaxID=69974 RepID=A0A090FE85_MESPL|nr:hypothetical protein MPLDJ20_260155 [Mesorhizobium plurifarium]
MPKHAIAAIVHNVHFVHVIPRPIRSATQ